MLQAQLEGKLTREEEDMEDLLTSNVFGVIKYLPLEDGLRPILACCSDLDGNVPTNALKAIESVDGMPKYEFWPRMQETECRECEPDVIITIPLANNRKIIVLVEAKYLSGKSSEAGEGAAPDDQVAREWDNLRRRTIQENATPILLYVTADLGYPRESIESSCEEYRHKRRQDMKVYWVSWRKLPSLFSSTKHEILKDLVKVLKRQGLTFFEGVTIPASIEIGWTFKALVNWIWSLYEGSRICWQFKAGKAFNWHVDITLFLWRFQR